VQILIKMQIVKEEKYNVYKLEDAAFTADLASQMEKSVAVSYSGGGMINFICDITAVKTVSPEAVKLFQKIVNITSKESGLFVLVTPDDDILDHISNTSEVHILMLPTVEEGIDAVFMNELENEFKEEGDDEFGESEADY
jgi:anti-sigma B factor antagonist